MALIDFDSSKVQDGPSREPIPEGWYAATITESAWCDTKDPSNDNKYVKLTIQIDADQHPSVGARLVWHNLNLVNENQTAVEIAARDLKAICEACSVPKLTDTEQLHGIPIAVKLTVKAETAQYAAGNEVKEFDMHSARFGGGAKPAASGSASAPPTGDNASPPASDKPAWMS